MTAREKFRAFIAGLYEKRDRYTKEEILEEAHRAVFAADEEIFFKQIPEGTYTKDELIDAVNAAMERRGRVEAMGGRI
jgi:hypothetical protein